MGNKEAYFNRLLELCDGNEDKKREFINESYKVALDTRKFEIDMYWRRANYFWLFIAAIFVAYFSALREKLEYVSGALSILGFLFSFGWNMVARGSKVWQENWEMHIRYLEEEIHGPLFKTFSLPNNDFWKLSKEYPFSVSKVNQILSLFTCLFWLGIFGYSLSEIFPDTWKYEIGIKTLNTFVFISFIVIFILGVVVLFTFSKSFQSKDLKKGNESNIIDYYKKTRNGKKTGDFYYYKRYRQQSILVKKRNVSILKQNWLNCIVEILKK